MWDKKEDTMSKTSQYITDIKQIIISARAKAHAAVNSAMVEAYWLIGKRIVEEEQHGKNRAEFGAHCAPNLTWSHIRRIIHLTDKNAMQYYLAETAANNWSVRTLDRNISTLYYPAPLVFPEKRPCHRRNERENIGFPAKPVDPRFVGIYQKSDCS
jgi:predicted nuclease of restriction endonuclease-like (RecB) superfamily